MKNQCRFYMPWYWPFWFFVGLLYLSSFLPYRCLLALGALLGRLIKVCATTSKRTAAINLSLCFPQKSPDDRARLLTNSFKNIGIAIFEIVLSLWGSDQQLKKMTTVHNQHFSDEAIAKGKGVLLVGAHFTTLEIAGRAGTEFGDFSVVYRPHKIAFLNFLLEKLMRQHYTRTIARHDIRGVIRALKNKGIVWYSADVNAKRRNSVFAPFFGVQAATVKAVSRYARLGNAVVIPIKHYRRDDGTGYDITLLPPLKDFPCGDDVADATRINQIIEAMVREKPAQYLWQYKRFKTRPAGMEKLY
jgi:Kdo2-lipid IVA lauroyltransferase/acyltransferase